jgi:hypothetical protein
METYSRMDVGVLMMSNLLSKGKLLHGMKQLLELRRMLRPLELEKQQLAIHRETLSIIKIPI